MQNVVAGILLDCQYRVLISERPVGKTHAGFWEFPGGKVEAGESLLTALVREFREELGIDTIRENWRQYYHGRCSNGVEIDFFLAQTCTRYSVRALENQNWQWVAVSKLTQFCFPEPNVAVIASLIQDISTFSR